MLLILKGGFFTLWGKSFRLGGGRARQRQHAAGSGYRAAKREGRSAAAALPATAARAASKGGCVR